MAPSPPESSLVHRLPQAPGFVGREEELAELHACWAGGFRGVVALTGLGGAGKTAIAAHFLEKLAEPGRTPRPEGLLVWSFYQEPDVGRFLEEAYHYFARGGPAAAPARGPGLLHLLAEGLATGGPHLLVLDGLERVQRQESAEPGRYGQVEDPLLKGLLTRLAEGIGRTVALVTSRFPLTDLQRLPGPGYRQVDVGGLGLPAARALLRQRGVRGDDATLGGLIDAYGAHALTLDHLGGLIGNFLEGDPGRAPELPALPATGDDRQGLRLARLLRAYEEHLPAAELALLCRLCLLRRSVTEEQLTRLFLCAPAVHARTARELADRIASLPVSNRYLGRDRPDLAEAIRVLVEEALCAAPIAGPEEVFRQEVLLAAAKVFELQEQAVEADFAELARFYAGKDLEGPTEQRPLSEGDRDLLRRMYARYVELRDRYLQTFQGPDPSLEEAFQELGYAKKLPALPRGETEYGDVRQAFEAVRYHLRHLTYKHFALRRVGELCRLYQRKWSLAGPLARVAADEFRQVLEALAGRRLALRDADGSFSVHPAVRDHFSRLAGAAEEGAWHDLIREQLVSLVQRPGHGLPEDARTLDLVEEAIYHALQAGRGQEAWWLFTEVLGGLRHLAWKLGEMARGLRILREFDPCPDRWALGWFLRALGELAEAYEQNDLSFFRADLCLLQGYLPRVAAQGDDPRTSVAAFLMGKTSSLPPPVLSCAVPRVQILLYLGRLDQARQSAPLDRLFQEIGWEGDRARCQLLLAEVARRQNDTTQCRHGLETASRWVLHSGSIEHLCLWHLVTARACRSGADFAGARRALDEGLHLARRCGLGLYQVELLCEQAEVFLARDEAAAAEAVAREALRMASAADCQFAWGAAAAGHVVGQALAAQRRTKEARAVLQKTLDLRRRIGDPQAEATERCLAELAGDTT
jgi:hypothetical protein